MALMHATIAAATRFWEENGIFVGSILEELDLRLERIGRAIPSWLLIK